MNCPECRNEMKESRETIRYKESGLNNIALQNIKVRTCEKCGNKLVSIPKIEELHRAIAVAFIKQKKRLSRDEIIFLRKYLGWSKADFAKKLRVKPAQVSRWESPTDPKKMEIRNELYLRALVALGKQIEDYKEHVDEAAVEDNGNVPVFSMSFSHKHWGMTEQMA